MKTPALIRNAAGLALAVSLLASCQIPVDYEPGAPLVAPIIQTMPGYVYTPYLSRPRIVDARDGEAGELMVCPYTGHPFVMPGTFYFLNRSDFTIPPAEERIAQAGAAQGVVVVNRTASVTRPAPSASVPAAVKPSKQELAYGTPVPGRAGFVYSPYADKHEIVDVQGLTSGMPVRCPFTGKLFRVP
jgi:hypothetical protein